MSTIRDLIEQRKKGTVQSVTVIEALQYIHGVATRAMVALNTGLNVRDSIDELDDLIEILDSYPDVLPRRV